MASMLNEQAYIAGTRFGLGIRPDEASRIAAAPGRWLMQQIARPQERGELFAGLSSSQQNMRAIYELKEEKAEGVAKQETQQKKREEFKAIALGELRAKLQLAITTSTPFYERLVDFWGNHFAVSMKKGVVTALAGSYEREAIRPHVAGKFADMLLAVAEHPAMLVYLDNAQSIGPDSFAGKRRDKGLNENLAREIMELHTLGVDGGYTQTDVTTFAKVITGWGIAGKNSPDAGAFEFTPRRHEPGTQTILGRSYEDDGQAQGVRVLRDLAAHPATAHHIATKLVRHFVSDTPPEQAVQKIAGVFSSTGGDLPAVYAALVELPEAWDVRRYPKIKSGYDLVVSAARASDRGADQYLLYSLGALKFLGDVPYTANSPAGQPDVARDIAGPEAMIRRVQWAQMAANKLEPSQKPMELAALTIGPILSDATREAITGARNDKEATAILFGSPEFQRR